MLFNINLYKTTFLNYIKRGFKKLIIEITQLNVRSIIQLLGIT